MSYGLLFLSAMISLIAQLMVKTAFEKGSRQHCNAPSAAQVAAGILMREGITDVRIERIHGNLTDHYDPRAKVLRLSDSVYNSNSAAALGVAAHECGHAIQHARGYAPLQMRTAIVPVVNLSSQLSIPLVFLGLAMEFSGLIDFGIILFSAVVAFHLVTLLVEFNASMRATRVLGQMNIMTTAELSTVKKVLSAAAMTYVAAALTAILQLVRLLGARRRDD